MSQDSNIRKERIERLLKELRYEITRGVMEREIEPQLQFSFVVPNGSQFVVYRIFSEIDHLFGAGLTVTPDMAEPLLRVVK